MYLKATILLSLEKMTPDIYGYSYLYIYKIFKLSHTCMIFLYLMEMPVYIWNLDVCFV